SIEVRTQYKMPPDLNVKNLGLPTWSCDSQQGFTSIRKYAEYQAENFKRSLKEESSAKYGMAETALKRRKMMEENSKLKEIKFGTNIDLSDDVKFKAQLTELAKMPPFCRVIADSNLLSHLGHTILGMNTVQLYMKVPGNRTPVHTENNSLASVNINIGAGNCEWFGVPYEYWGVIDKKCREEIHSEARRSRVGRCWLRALGAEYGMVQQCGMERGTDDVFSDDDGNASI
ncbi:hypothetical protein PENTCL1PPCAC_27451, partial [Pristionchus entomophagus]